MTFWCARRGYVRQVPYLRRVAYLESHGTEWIDTKHIPIDIDLISGSFSIPQKLNAWATLLGSMTSQTEPDCVRIQETSGSGRLGGGMGYENTVMSNVISLNEIHSFEMDVVHASVDNYEVNYSKRFTSSVLPIYLFKNNSGGSALGSIILRIHSFSVSQNGSFVLNQIPVLDLSGRPAMYDEVSGQFFYNQGTGEFTWGELDSQTI